ncbi:hypothetical protein LEMA_P123290.1 [Plenodomus lingam JN3]|uniref:Chitin-binding type-1 domain-containing protein n=1 Tax=Leptosphaeria maculans (strain JN3 / isolate v23.1.3 / race Av1-4-5-6-7-8) TaxID=985895 RepID=E4ZRZ7_LEPMJ|nr:hypothetical protein LEMA_P123290.1 [Plenodomus lingam JN3]CBX94177.1 hypothetical protein LEMA_P123290.1 [Plenodomus lingam JN3]
MVISSVRSATPTPGLIPTRDGTCGTGTNYNCIGYVDGDCCSQYGYCGLTAGHCGAGCQIGYGRCDGLSSSVRSTVAGISIVAGISTIAGIPSISSTRIATPSVVPGLIPTRDGSCGTGTNYNCIGYVDGDCCSQYGYCGLTAGHCGAGCQTGYGRCDGLSSSTVAGISTIAGISTVAGISSTRSATPSTVSGLVTSRDGTCGTGTNYNCIGYVDGECCSQYGYCGLTAGHCGAGCQAGYGRCNLLSLSSSVGSSVVSISRTQSATPSALPGLIRSPDGTCGPNTNYNCIGYVDGECCSQNGYCGLTPAHCGTGCQSGYGRCNLQLVSSFVASTVASISRIQSTTPSTLPGLILSTDGSCGAGTNYNCIGYVDGECCSQYGYCGLTAGHCGAGCQAGYGKCDIQSAGLSSSTRAATSALPPSSVRPNFPTLCSKAVVCKQKS